MLSDEEIDKLYKPGKPYSTAKAIERAVMQREAEVHKQDKILIQEMRDVLDHIQRRIGFGTATIHYNSATWSDIDRVVSLADSRLDGGSLQQPH